MIMFRGMDRRVIGWMSRNALMFLRYSFGITYLWSGLLKLFPSMWRAAEMSKEDMGLSLLGFLAPAMALRLVGIFECLMAVNMILGIFPRATFAMVLAQVPMQLLPLLMKPVNAFIMFPFVPTFDTLVHLRAAAMTIAAALVLAAVQAGGTLVMDTGARLKRPVVFGSGESGGIPTRTRLQTADTTASRVY